MTIGRARRAGSWFSRRSAAHGAKGFTLIELLIVVIVLGILAAIVVFALSSVRKDSVAAGCRSDGKLADQAATAYATKHGVAAPSNTDLVPDYVKNWPSSSDYTITYTPAGGDQFSVTGTLSDGRSCYPTLAAAPPTTGLGLCTITGGSANPASTTTNSGHLTQDVTVTIQTTGSCSGMALGFTPGGPGFTGPESLALPNPSGGSTSVLIPKNAYKWSPGAHSLAVSGGNAFAVTLTVT